MLPRRFYKVEVLRGLARRHHLHYNNKQLSSDSNENVTTNAQPAPATVIMQSLLNVILAIMIVTLREIPTNYQCIARLAYATTASPEPHVGTHLLYMLQVVCTVLHFDARESTVHLLMHGERTTRRLKITS